MTATSTDRAPSTPAADGTRRDSQRSTMTAKEAVVTTVASGAIAAAVLQWVIPICLVC